MDKFEHCKVREIILDVNHQAAISNSKFGIIYLTQPKTGYLFKNKVFLLFSFCIAKNPIDSIY